MQCRRSGWGSANSTAWRGGADTRVPSIVIRDPPAAAAAAPWSPHPGPPAAVGVCQEVIVTQGVKPGWGSMGNGTWGQRSQSATPESRGRDSERTPQRRAHHAGDMARAYAEEQHRARSSQGTDNRSWSPMTAANPIAELKGAIVTGQRSGSMTVAPAMTNARTALARAAARRSALTAISLVQLMPETDQLAISTSLSAPSTSMTETSSAASQVATTVIRLMTRKTRRCVPTIGGLVTSSQVVMLTSQMTCLPLSLPVSSTRRTSCMLTARNICARRKLAVRKPASLGRRRLTPPSLPSHL